jgi:hypothetical protein
MARKTFVGHPTLHLTVALTLVLHRDGKVVGRAALLARVPPDDGGSRHRIGAAGAVLTHAALEMSHGLVLLLGILPQLAVLHVQHPLDVRMALVCGLAAVALAREGRRLGRLDVLGLDEFDARGNFREVGQLSAVVVGYGARDDVVVLVSLSVWFRGRDGS